jgi:hypothetical protein
LLLRAGATPEDVFERALTFTRLQVVSSRCSVLCAASSPGGSTRAPDREEEMMIHLPPQSAAVAIMSIGLTPLTEERVLAL